MGSGGLRIHGLAQVQVDFFDRTKVVTEGSIDCNNPSAPVQAVAGLILPGVVLMRRA